MSGFSIINWSNEHDTTSRPTLAEALEVVTEPTDFIGPDDRWEIVKLPRQAGSVGPLLSSEGERHHGPISSERAAELLGQE